MTQRAVNRISPRGLLVPLLFAAFFSLGARAQEAAPAWIASTSSAPLVDPKTADAQGLAREAAKRALAGLQGKTPRAVVVYCFRPYDYNRVLDGVAEVFDRSLISGSPSFGAFTQAGNVNALAILALGGDITATAVLADMERGAGEAATTLINSLREPHAAAKVAAEGELVWLMGNNQPPRDEILVQRLAKELSADLPVAGGTGSGGVFYQGKVMTNMVVGLHLRGPFSLGFGLRGTQGVRTQPDLLENSRLAVREARFHAGKGKGLLLVANCVSRRDNLGPLLEQEIGVMSAEAPGQPIFGYFGNSEIGRPASGPPNAAVTHALTVVFLENNGK